MRKLIDKYCIRIAIFFISSTFFLSICGFLSAYEVFDRRAVISLDAVSRDLGNISVEFLVNRSGNVITHRTYAKSDFTERSFHGASIEGSIYRIMSHCDSDTVIFIGASSGDKRFDDSICTCIADKINAELNSAPQIYFSSVDPLTAAKAHSMGISCGKLHMMNVIIENMPDAYDNVDSMLRQLKNSPDGELIFKYSNL